MRRDWTVLLIGGASGTGKTAVARDLGLRLGVPWVEADVIRLAMQEAVGPRSGHILNYVRRDTQLRSAPPAELARIHERVSRAALPGLAMTVKHRVWQGSPIILEGDDVRPAFVARMLRFSERVRAVILVEDNMERLRRNIERRDRGLSGRSTAYAERVIALAQHDARRINRQARSLGLTCVDSHPLRTLAARVLRAVSAG